MGEEETKTFDGDWIILRSALLYGGKPEYKLCFCDQLYSQLKEGRKVNLFFDEYRTTLHVSDVGEAIENAIRNRPAKEIYNLAGSERITRAEFGETLALHAGFDPNLIQRVSVSSISTRAPRPMDLSLKIEKIRSHL